jgi:hypothetical protein
LSNGEEVKSVLREVASLSQKEMDDIAGNEDMEMRRYIFYLYI